MWHQVPSITSRSFQICPCGKWSLVWIWCLSFQSPWSLCFAGFLYFPPALSSLGFTCACQTINFPLGAAFPSSYRDKVQYFKKYFLNYFEASVRPTGFSEMCCFFEGFSTCFCCLFSGLVPRWLQNILGVMSGPFHVCRSQSSLVTVSHARLRLPARQRFRIFRVHAALLCFFLTDHWGGRRCLQLFSVCLPHSPFSSCSVCELRALLLDTCPLQSLHLTAPAVTVSKAPVYTWGLSLLWCLLCLRWT